MIHNPSLGWLFYRFGCRRTPEQRLHIINRELEKMMATAQELLDKVAAIKTSLAGIRQDITDIKNGLPASGGIDAAGVESLRAALDDVVTEAAGLDAENPAA